MYNRSILSALSMLGLLACGTDQIPERSQAAPVHNDMDWLIGAWQDTNSPNQWEMWRKSNDEYYGRGMSIKDGDTALFEQMIIYYDRDKLVFTALVKENAAPVDFVSTKIGDGTVVFENAHHDFPKVISYRNLKQPKGPELMQTEVSAGEKRIQMVLRKAPALDK